MRGAKAGVSSPWLSALCTSKVLLDCIGSIGSITVINSFELNSFDIVYVGQPEPQVGVFAFPVRYILHTI